MSSRKSCIEIYSSSPQPPSAPVSGGVTLVTVSPIGIPVLRSPEILLTRGSLVLTTRSSACAGCSWSPEDASSSGMAASAAARMASDGDLIVSGSEAVGAVVISGGQYPTEVSPTQSWS